MTRKSTLLSGGTFLVIAFAFGFMALGGETTKIQQIENSIAVQPTGSRAACSMTKTNGVAAQIAGIFDSGMAVYTYYDPSTMCSSPTYPFEITSFSFTLYEIYPVVTVWPAMVDVVVYDIAPGFDSCDGPGNELCRVSISADEQTFGFPNVGTVQFPAPCCVDGPFFIGVEYMAGHSSTNPAIPFDFLTPPDTCNNWIIYINLVLYEWFDLWNQPVPGYPLYWVDGETMSPSCGDICAWHPGDPYKQHYPQMPDQAGWAVNATEPVSLGDDFMCMETGALTDFHFWGAWRHQDVGEILGFRLSIHEDIPAEQNPDGYSKPGALLWEAWAPQFTSTGHYPTTNEGWYDPVTGGFFESDHFAYWQYNICLDEQDWFEQDSGTVYWINISAVVEDPLTTVWGWKSSVYNWNDDAVWGFADEENWIEMHAPPLFESSLDLSFIVTGGCCQMSGDLDNNGGTDVADLSYIVDYLFRGGPPPSCLASGDCNGSGGIDVADLGYIVDYLFRGGPPPGPC